LAVIGALLLLLSLPGMRSFTEEEGPDPSKIVVDEMAGFIVAGLFHARTLTSALILFFLFRIFDILKPWPASWANRQEGLVHVVLDDLAAGLYASLLHALLLLVIR
ncbi:MAG: phosphatidylglycerophosphatase A, partial [Deltaproteobacteria bacterium]